MLSARELTEAASQLQAFRRDGEKYLQTQGDILERYSALLEDYKRLQSDHEEARESRDKYKQQVRGQDRDPFVLVLVDGDGYVFEDNLVSNGADGGSNAANLLNEAIKSQLRRLNLDHCRVMVRIYANLVGLSKALSFAKLCGADKRSLAPFVANFNRSGDLFDFVDAGELKENADFKIRAVLRQFVESTQCKHIFFAACHDVGYVSELKPYTGDKDRLTLIKNYAFHHEFSKLNLREEILPGIFRNTPFSNERTAVTAKTPPLPQQLDHLKTASIDSANIIICGFYQKGLCKYGSGCKFKHVNYNTASPATTQENKFQMTSLAKSDHDFMSGNSDMGNKTRDRSGFFDPAASLPREEHLQPNKIALNAQQHRLDPYAPPSSREDRIEFEARVAKQKLCNNYHIGGYCSNGAACSYDHSRINKNILDCLKFVARHQPCPKRGDCRSAGCYLGHICQRPDCKHRGGKSFCRIPTASHNVSLDVAESVTGIETYRATESGKDITPSDGSAAESESDREGAAISDEDADRQADYKSTWQADAYDLRA